MAELRRGGYRLTPQRRAVINVVTGGSDHLTPLAIHRRVRQEHPDIGLATVYRTLEALDRIGLLCQLHTASGCRSYTVGAAEHHHHLVCSGCQRVVSLPECGLEEMMRDVAEETGFTIEDHLLEFAGLCPDCQKAVDREGRWR